MRMRMLGIMLRPRAPKAGTKGCGRLSQKMLPFRVPMIIRPLILRVVQNKP